MKRSVSSIVLLLMLAVHVSCASYPEDTVSVPGANSEMESLVFRNLYWPSTLEVSVDQYHNLRWELGIDAGGPGFSCLPESDMRCLILDGAWSFAVPKSALESPIIGSSWTFRDHEYRLEEVVNLQKTTGELMVIRAADNRDNLIFHYSKSCGLQYVSYDVELGDETDGAKTRSVWVRISETKDGCR